MQRLAGRPVVLLFGRLSRAMATNSSLRPPDLSSRAVATLVRELFPFEKVEEGSVKQFPSYDDRNYYFQGTLGDAFVLNSKGVQQNEIVEKEFVLKINSTAFIPCEVIKGLNCIMNHLKGKGVQCPYPLTSRDGRQLEIYSESQLLKNEGNHETSDKEREFGIRVLVFLPGEMLDTIDRVHITPRLMYETGKYIGNLDAALQEFHHPAISSRVFLKWDLQHFLTLKRFLSSVEDMKKRNMAERVFQSFEEHVSPKIPLLKRGTIHGDTNGLNIIVDKYNGSYQIAGIIDFGDCVHTCYVFELAITIAYAMTENATPLQLSCPMLSGYLQAFPMTEEELDCLYYCVLARLVQTAVLGEYQFREEPWNAYLLTTPAKAWRVMEEILATPKDKVDKMWTIAGQRTMEY